MVSRAGRWWSGHAAPLDDHTAPPRREAALPAITRSAYSNNPHSPRDVRAASDLQYPPRSAGHADEPRDLHFVRLLLARRRTPANPWLAFAYSLASYPVIVGLLAGQSCFLSLWLLSGAAAFAMRGQALLSGLLLGALAYKPHLAFGFLLLFALDRSLRWRALAGFSLSAALSMIACVLVSAHASREYVLSLGELADVQTRFRLALSVTGRAFFEQLVPSQPGLARALGAALGLACAGAFCVWARRERRLRLRLAGAVWLTLAAAPHASVYEWTLLLVPLALLRRELGSHASRPRASPFCELRRAAPREAWRTASFRRAPCRYALLATAVRIPRLGPLFL